MKNSYIIAGVIILFLGIAYFAMSSGNEGDVAMKSSVAATVAPQNEVEQMQDNKTDSDMTEPTLNIVETAISAGSFNTLVAAVEAAGLVDTLSGTGPFTVFAPTDDAFAKVPEATLNALLEDPNALANVLTYHVVPGKVMAEDVINLTKATTVQGQDVTIDTSEGVMVNNAKVIQTDIETSNGVIHVIDAVILPPAN